MKKKHPIEALIEQGEHQQLDFKFEVSDSKKIARTLSAFANTDGGRLLIGVKDNGNYRYAVFFTPTAYNTYSRRRFVESDREIGLRFLLSPKKWYGSAKWVDVCCSGSNL